MILDHGLYPVPIQRIQIGRSLIQKQGFGSVGE